MARRRSNSQSEEPQVEEPQVEEPQVEEPQVEEPQVEEPQVEEPQVEEPLDGEGVVYLMIRPGRNQPFRRTVAEGVTLVFEPKTPQAIPHEYCEKLAKDIGRALVIVEFDEKQRHHVDEESTMEVHSAYEAEMAEARANHEAERQKNLQRIIAAKRKAKAEERKQRQAAKGRGRK